MAEDYGRLADAFMFGPAGPDVVECVRPQGGFTRYDRMTREYGAVNRRGFVVTYFIPDPAVHGEPDNLTYFRQKCR
jgi:filamentous hemagglutinin